MSPRRKTDKPEAAPPPADDDAEDTAAEEESEEEVEVEVEAAVPEAELDPDLDLVEAEEEEEEDEEEDLEEEEEVVKPVLRTPVRPSPGRPPSAKEEPEPPFFIGERVRLIQNTRPRTGSPIGDHPVGAEGRVETVLSQTAIIRFDRAPDQKEVVAFVCLDSIDDEAKARRAEREREKEREAEAERAAAARQPKAR